MPRAIATLVYGDDRRFVEGAVALGQSIERVDAARVALYPWGREPGPWARRRLREDGGWAKLVAASARWRKPAKSRVSSPRLELAYAKLALFEMIAYDRIAYLDADVLAAAPGGVRKLLECSGFCASLRHSELFNSGVLVLEPSLAAANALSASLEAYSYTGGDQGLLNSVFPRVVSCPEFNARDDGGVCHRLPATFNDDWPLSFIRGNSGHRPLFVHYTLGSAKAWSWQLAPFLPSPWRGHVRLFLPLEALLVLAAAVALARFLGRREIRVCSPLATLALAAVAFVVAFRAVPDDVTNPLVAWTVVVATTSCLVAVPTYAYVSASGSDAHRLCPAAASFVFFQVAVLCLPRLVLGDTWTLAELLAVELPLMYVAIVTLTTTCFVRRGTATSDELQPRNS